VTSIAVVAAVVEREGRFLLGRRPPDKRHGGLWEFPGGKVGDGESPADAASRELAEELRLGVTDVGRRLHAIADAGSPFVIEFYPVSVSGTPTAIEHTTLGWFSLEELLGMELAPADDRFVRWLRRRRDLS